MTGSPEESNAKRQVKLVISETAYQRLRTWSYLDDEGRPELFLGRLVESLTETVAEEVPAIDDLIRRVAELRPNGFGPPTG